MAMALHPDRDQLYVVTSKCLLALNPSTLVKLSESNHGVLDVSIRSAQVYESQLFVGLHQDVKHSRNGAIIVLSLESGREGERLRTITLPENLQGFTIHQDLILASLYWGSLASGPTCVNYNRSLFNFSMTGELISKQDPMRSGSDEFFDITSHGDEILVADTGRSRVYTLRHAGVDGALQPEEYPEESEPEQDESEEELEEEMDSDDEVDSDEA